jgi:hypothetical protein
MVSTACLWHGVDGRAPDLCVDHRRHPNSTTRRQSPVDSRTEANIPVPLPADQPVAHILGIRRPRAVPPSLPKAPDRFRFSCRSPSVAKAPASPAAAPPAPVPGRRRVGMRPDGQVRAVHDRPTGRRRGLRPLGGARSPRRRALRVSLCGGARGRSRGARRRLRAGEAADSCWRGSVRDGWRLGSGST